MFWLSWRQHRTQILVTLVFLLAIGALLLITGLDAQRYINENAPAGCPAFRQECLAVGHEIMERLRPTYELIGWMPMAVPALIGAFWGAPLLAREFERGTGKIAWTQSIPLRRWLLSKLGFLALTVTVLGLAYSAITNAWFDIYKYGNPYDSTFNNPGIFSQLALVPAAWSLFGFAVGVAAGALSRRTIPAMAVTLALVGLTFPVLISMHDNGYAEPVHMSTVDSDAVYKIGGILAGSRLLDSAGEEVDIRTLGGCAVPLDGNTDQLVAREQEAQCFTDRGYRYSLTYQPIERFWQFQWTEVGILVTASLALGAFTVFWTLRRRI